MSIVDCWVSESVLGVPVGALGCLGVPWGTLGCSLGEETRMHHSVATYLAKHYM